MCKPQMTDLCEPTKGLGLNVPKIKSISCVDLSPLDHETDRALSIPEAFHILCSNNASHIPADTWCQLSC